MSRRRALAVLGPIAVGAILALTLGAHGRGAGAATSVSAGDDLPLKEVKHDKSPPLRTIASKSPKQGRMIRKEHRFIRPVGGVKADTAVQSVNVGLSSPTPGVGFKGITMNPNDDQATLPPDPNSAVGPSHIVEVTNTKFQVFSKNGASLYGPVYTNTIWSGFGGDCEFFNDGDATVEYDRMANRWIIQQFEVTSTPYLDCIAVSATGDPTGAWYRYAFSGFKDNFPDYPKLGVWPDAYYVTYNLFQFGLNYVGVQVCAYDRAKMLAGQSAQTACKKANDVDLNGLLPSDLDGSTPPPAGSPNYLLGLRGNGIRMYTAKPNFSASPATLALTATPGIAVSGVPGFQMACGGTNCIPQKNTDDLLDSLGDRLMYRLAYRNFGDHQSLVVTHSVNAGSTTGLRWYEIRNPAAPTVYQSGTYAPNDGKYRWMGSVSMDKSGDIALGYSISNATTFPGIAYTGRLVGDAPGTMTQGETNMKAGAGSQISDDLGCDPTFCSLRWGDYTSMQIDPSDDCTFWYTNQFMPNTGNFNWSTWIGSFKLPGCGSGGPPPPGNDDFSISAAPTNVTIARGSTGKTIISTAVTDGSAQSINLTATGVPSKVKPTFVTNPITAGATSKLKFAVGSGATKGTYTGTVTGLETGGATHSTTVSLKVT